MKTISRSTTLLYYDGVQVFEGLDPIGGHYIALLVERKDDGDQYVVVGISPEALQKFRTAAIDLRNLLLQREEQAWYLAYVRDDFSSPIQLELQKGEEIPEAFLPGSGFILELIKAGVANV